MTYIITTRNPSNNKLIIIKNGDDDDWDEPTEFSTYDEADDCASNIAICQAWGYDILEAP